MDPNELMLGELVDEIIYGDVRFIQGHISAFVAASGALFLTHTALDFARYGAGLRR